MPTICETDPTVYTLTDARKVQLENIPNPVDRTFKISGMSECERVTIIVKDSAGNIIYGPRQAEPGTNVGTEFFWQTEIEFIRDFNGVTVIAYCGSEADGDRQDGINIIKGVSTIEVVDDPVPGPKRLKFIFRINHWRAKWQSSILVVSGRLKKGGTVKYSHIFTENPPREHSFDFGFVDPGFYIGQYTVIDGQTSVTTATTVKVIKPS